MTLLIGRMLWGISSIFNKIHVLCALDSSHVLYDWSSWHSLYTLYVYESHVMTEIVAIES